MSKCHWLAQSSQFHLQMGCAVQKHVSRKVECGKLRHISS